jgi:ABC-type branched-subunit amino acid transport system ATPase component
MIEWLENYLSSSKSTILMVTHDRYFLEVVCDTILELADQTIYRYKGNFSYYLEKKAERQEQTQSTIEKAKNTFRKELDWIRRQPKARGVKQKARVDAFQDVKKVASQRLDEDELELPVKMERLGSKIVEFHKVSKSYPNRVILNDFSYNVQRQERLGIVGNNGAGKTTFFNLLTGLFFPTEGSISYKGRDITRMSPPERVALGLTRSFQLTSTFDSLSVVDNLALAYFRASRTPTIASLLFTRTRSFHDHPKIRESIETFDLAAIEHRLVQSLSLGEKRRLEIAMAVLVDPEVLLLDEPLAGLAESEIKGVLGVLRRQIGRQTILIVEHKISHIQDFVQRLVVMHDGRVIAEGGYEECLNHPEVRRSYWQIDPAEDAQHA